MKTMKVTELQKQVGVIGAATVLFLLIGIWLVITPGIKQMAQIRKSISQVGQKNETLRKIEDLSGKVELMQSKLEAVSQKNSVLSHLATLANRQKLEVESVSPDEVGEAASGFYQDYVLKLKAAGGFRQLIGFFGAVEKMNPPIAVVDMELTNQPSSGRNNTRVRSALSMSMVLKTLLISSKPGEKTFNGGN